MSDGGHGPKHDRLVADYIDALLHVGTAVAVAAPDDAEIPAWGRQPFLAMPLWLGGLQVALRRAAVDGVLRWTGPEYWRRASEGVVYKVAVHQGQSVDVLDMARIVLPRDRWVSDEESAAPAQEVVLVHGGRCGLLCDRTGEDLLLAPADVTWRTARTRCTWLAGTVGRHGCALLDPANLLMLAGLGAGE
jgi:purine-binding chemotaxis protein CheW